MRRVVQKEKERKKAYANLPNTPRPAKNMRLLMESAEVECFPRRLHSKLTTTTARSCSSTTSIHVFFDPHLDPNYIRGRAPGHQGLARWNFKTSTRSNYWQSWTCDWGLYSQGNIHQSLAGTGVYFPTALFFIIFDSHDLSCNERVWKLSVLWMVLWSRRDENRGQSTKMWWWASSKYGHPNLHQGW